MSFKVTDIQESQLESEVGSLRSVIGLGSESVVRDSFVLMSPGDDGPKNITMGYTVVYPGCRTRGHEHGDREEAYYVVRGKGIAVVGKEEFEIGEGTAFYIPCGEFHAVRNPSKTCLEYVWAVVPAT